MPQLPSILRGIVGAVLGGALGSAVRALCVSWLAPDTSAPLHLSSYPWALMAVNTLGCYLASRWLSGGLSGRDVSDARRLTMVSGFLGGLTSYSGLWVAIDKVATVSWVGALATLVCSLALGTLAVVMGARRS